jgi:type II secretory pathway pseudopilin PulG
MMISHLHGLSNGLEQFLFRHQYMFGAVTALCAVAVVVISLLILAALTRQAASSKRAVQIAAAQLFISNLDRFTDQLGYLSYLALLGQRPSKDFAAPRDGLSRLLSVLSDKAIAPPARPTDDLLIGQFRTKAAVVRSAELQILYTRIENLVEMANSSGHLEMLDRRITELHVEIGKDIGSIRGPG